MGYPPGVDEFKAQFTRDFVYGGTNGGQETVLDSDIQRALNETPIAFNASLWGSTEINTAFLYAAAHFMVLNIQAAGGLSVRNQGMGVKSKGGGTIESKGVGGVNVGFAVPDFVRQSPILSQFMRTDYGQKYIQLLTPRLVGNLATISGSEPVTFAGTVNPMSITTLSLPSGTHLVAYSQHILVTGGVVPLVYAVSGGSLPTGLTLNASTGLISGTPSVAGTSYFQITVTDGRDSKAYMNYKLVIA